VRPGRIACTAAEYPQCQPDNRALLVYWLAIDAMRDDRMRAQIDGNDSVTPPPLEVRVEGPAAPTVRRGASGFLQLRGAPFAREPSAYLHESRQSVLAVRETKVRAASTLSCKQATSCDRAGARSTSRPPAACAYLREGTNETPTRPLRRYGTLRCPGRWGYGAPLTTSACTREARRAKRPGRRRKRRA